MNIYTTDKIRNVVLLGHGGCGKDYRLLQCCIGHNNEPPFLLHRGFRS